MPFNFNNTAATAVNHNSTAMDKYFMNGSEVFSAAPPAAGAWWSGATHTVTVGVYQEYRGYDANIGFNIGSISPTTIGSSTIVACMAMDLEAQDKIYLETSPTYLVVTLSAADGSSYTTSASGAGFIMPALWTAFQNVAAGGLIYVRIVIA